MRLDPNERARLQWKAMDWALYTRCAACGEQRHCRGRERGRLVCFGCYSSDQSTAKAKRGGKPGPRKGYTYTKRRSKQETIALVRQLNAEGVVRKEIADRVGVSDRTVANYLSARDTDTGREFESLETQARSLMREAPHLVEPILERILAGARPTRALSAGGGFRAKLQSLEDEARVLMLDAPNLVEPILEKILAEQEARRAATPPVEEW